MSCSDCNGSGKYFPLFGPAETCRACGGSRAATTYRDLLESRQLQYQPGSPGSNFYYDPVSLDVVRMELYQDHPDVISGRLRAGMYNCLSGTQTSIYSVPVEVDGSLYYLDPYSYRP